MRIPFLSPKPLEIDEIEDVQAPEDDRTEPEAEQPNTA